MNTITTLIQAAERMIRDTKTPMGELCATWNRLNFEANTGLSFSTPARRTKLIERLEAAIIELNSRDDRMNDGIDDREFSGNSIAADHDEAIEINNVHPEITAHNDLCDLVKAPQHLYAGEELDLTVCFNRRRFEELKAQLNAFINKETPRYFVTNNTYKVTPSGFVYRWNAGKGEWVESRMSIIDLINVGAKEITPAEFIDRMTNTRAKISQDGERWFVLVDAGNNRQHLYEFHDEYDAVEYAQRVNAE